MNIELEIGGESDTGWCECCGNNTRTVWGYLHAETGTVGVYYVRWTTGHFSDRGADFDLILGAWGDGTRSEDRVAVGLECRRQDDQPSSMVVDAEGRAPARSELVGQALRRDEVIGGPIAENVFALIDVVWLEDPRLSELRGR